MVYLAIMKQPAYLALLWLFLIPAGFVSAQTEAEFEANYAKRIRMETINDVYIPVDLEDAYAELERLADADGLTKFKNAPEEEIRRRLHFGLGRWIMINWGLEEGSRISHYLSQKGITVPDDMVRIIIVTWHRRLHGKPLGLEEEIALVAKRMAEEKAKREARIDTVQVIRKE